VPKAEWTLAGRMRHKLFHGAITDSTESREDIEFATSIIRHTLILALKHFIGVPTDAPPFPPPKSIVACSALVFSHVVSFLEDGTTAPASSQPVAADRSD
jgi:hypothetical protein